VRDVGPKGKIEAGTVVHHEGGTVGSRGIISPVALLSDAWHSVQVRGKSEEGKIIELNKEGEIGASGGARDSPGGHKKKHQIHSSPRAKLKKKASGPIREGTCTSRQKGESNETLQGGLGRVTEGIARAVGPNVERHRGVGKAWTR